MKLVRLENLIVTLVSKIFPEFNGARMFITVFTTARH